MALTRPRAAVAATALVAAAAALAGCQYQPGAAAFVGATRISDGQVAAYLAPTGAPPSSAATSARAQAVTLLVQNLIYRDYLGAKHAAPSAGALHAAVVAAAGGQLAQASATVRGKLAAAGLRPSFLQPVLDNVGLQTLAIKAAGLSPTNPTAAEVSAFLAGLAKASGPVRLSPRYGTWNAAQLSATGAADPPYLKTTAPLVNGAPTVP